MNRKNMCIWNNSHAYFLRQCNGLKFSPESRTFKNCSSNCLGKPYSKFEDEKSVVVNPSKIIRFKGSRTLPGERICTVDHQSSTQLPTFTVFFYCSMNAHFILYFVGKWYKERL
ncbi:uncharacterized protein LOC122574602 [Bombus pyrosoma]|uniref:uncharacterized protein LOC122574602 n=1 Tax=Bombus pyrosoma TaxID=396416 RepID=UPI001CB9537B|nr:uncharacterized protein LOC122574602 [Bombus pyrosoma]